MEFREIKNAVDNAAERTRVYSEYSRKFHRMIEVSSEKKFF